MGEMEEQGQQGQQGHQGQQGQQGEMCHGVCVLCVGAGLGTNIDCYPQLGCKTSPD